MSLIKIGNKKIDGIKEFFYDGCHKIYLIEDENDKQNFYKNGWSKNNIKKIDELEQIYDNSCFLRFINTCKLKTVVDQGEQDILFIYTDHTSIV